MPIEEVFVIIAATLVVIVTATLRCGAGLTARKDSVDALNKIVSIVAVVLGGVWVYTEFVSSRAAFWNVQLKLDSHILPHASDDKVILVADVYFKNLGRTEFQPDKRGLWLHVGEVAVTDGYGALKIPGSATSKIAHIQMLKNFILEPGCEYHETAAIVVPRDKTIAVLTKLNDLDDQVIIRSKLP